MRDALTTASYGADPAELYALMEYEQGLFLPFTLEVSPLTVDSPPVAVFRAMDSTGAFDGGPYPAHLLRHVRDNIEATARERWWSNGVSLNRVTGSFAGLSSPWPVPWGPFWVYAPGGARDLRVRLSCGDTDSYGSPAARQGADAIRLCVTSIAPDGRAIAPPADASHPAWVTLRAGEDLPTVDVPLFGRQLSGPGWCGALLWTWSVIDPTALDTGEITGMFGPNVIELDGDNLNDTVPHIVLQVFNDWGADKGLSLGGPEDGPIFGVGHRRDRSGAVEMAVVPPAREAVVETWANINYGGWSIFGLGYVEVLGVTLLAEPDGPRVPGVDVYASNTPASSGADAPLVGAAAKLGRTRVPTWGGHPISVRADTTPWLGRWLGDDGDTLRITDSTARPLCSVIIPHAITDLRGYTAVVSFQTANIQATRETANLLMRFAAYSLSGGSDVFGEWVPVEQYWSHTPEEEGWSGVLSQIQGGRRSGGGGGMYWRWLGSLMGWPDDIMREIPRTGHQVLNWFGGEIPDALGYSDVPDLNLFIYPMDLRIECRLDRTDVDCFVYVCGAGIASLYRDIPL